MPGTPARRSLLARAVETPFVAPHRVRALRWPRNPPCTIPASFFDFAI
jgi:hypothetical protein